MDRIVAHLCRLLRHPNRPARIRGGRRDYVCWCGHNQFKEIKPGQGKT